MGWKSKKDGTHFNTDKIKRSSDGSTEVNIEIDNNSDDFSEDIRKDFDRKKKIIDIYNFDELSESAKDNAREWYRSGIGNDDYFSDYDGIIYDEKSGLSDYDVFDNYSKKYYDLDRAQYIQFPDLIVKDENKLGKMLGIPESLVNKISFRFEDPHQNNTVIKFIRADTGEELDFNGNNYDYDYNDYKKYAEEGYVLTNKQFETLRKATEKWDDLMSSAWKSLRDNYEYQLSDESVDDNIISNEYEFDNDGNRVVM